ncbi:MAG: hypothetical protein MI784_14215 [Cytophagales bacterium]|nr:hypothetical protein [Cytophagales bacterium]
MRNKRHGRDAGALAIEAIVSQMTEMCRNLFGYKLRLAVLLAAEFYTTVP